MKIFTSFAVLWWLAATGCTPEGDAPNPPPSTTTTTVAQPPEPPDQEFAQPEDYITRERAGTCSTDPDSRDNTGLCADIFHQIQTNASRGWRDFLVLADKCSWALEPSPDALFPIDVAEAREFAGIGAMLDAEGWGFMMRLGETNRRCDEQPRFCGRTNVQSERVSAFRDRLRDHLFYASELRTFLNGQPGAGLQWDSIAGWCNQQ